MHFEQRYTMASERNIHRGKSSTTQSGTHSIVGAPLEDVQDLDSILF